MKAKTFYITWLILLITSLIVNFAFGDELKHIEFDKNVLQLQGDVTKEMATRTKIYLDLHPNDTKILIYINSLGGEVESGRLIIKNLKLSGKETICIAKTAMSMAMYIFQSCDVRYVVKSSLLMSHGMLLGLTEMQYVNDLQPYIEKLQKEDKQLHSIVEKRLGLTHEQLLAHEQPEWFIVGSDNILKNNAADEEVTISCKKEIEGLFKPVNVYDPNRGVVRIVNYSRVCPL